MKDTETEKHGMDSGTATEAVVCQVGGHQHQLANRCSLGENFKMHKVRSYKMQCNMGMRHSSLE